MKNLADLADMCPTMIIPLWIRYFIPLRVRYIIPLRIRYVIPLRIRYTVYMNFSVISALYPLCTYIVLLTFFWLLLAWFRPACLRAS